ncbi:hypothetical protein HD554DRAFT_2043456 [Boletus coccyginus]|nr:hypothetical protein HD554DRAFT_2043456 [Boletus coccyginus]
MNKPRAPESTSANKCKELLAKGVASALLRKKKSKTTGSTIDFDKAKYKLVRRKLTCFLHPFGSPRTTIDVGLKVKSSCEVLSHALGLAEELSNWMEANKLQNICTWINNEGHEIIRALQDGTIRTTAANWPTCFYEDGVYDPENRAKGLFFHPRYQKTVPEASLKSHHQSLHTSMLCWAFPKGHGCFNDLDSNDNMTKIHAQHACLLKKATHSSRLEICAIEAIKFATPPPETTSIPSSKDPGNKIQSHSSVSILSILNAATTAVIKSDLSPCMSDNEAKSTQMPVAYKTTDATVASTSVVALLLSAPAPSSHLSTGPVELKKGHALATKKPHCRGGKKSNRF